MNHIMRGIKFTFFFGGVDGKFFEEVFIHMANQVFFLAESLMADFIYLIHQLLDIIRCQVARSKGAFDEAAF